MNDSVVANGYKKFKGENMQFFINGKPYQIDPSKVALETSLNTFIRDHAQLTGTKFMCLEGGCGACVVTVTRQDVSNGGCKSWAVNSCLTPIYACDGLCITTVEGIGNRKDGYHATQARLAKFNGTQCGYCSPGMVMNMYSLLEAKNGKVTMEDVENSFGGNICRCTGYRPILDAFKSLATDADPKYQKMCTDIEDLPEICFKNGQQCSKNCTNIAESIHLKFENSKEWIKAVNLEDLFNALSEIENKSYMLVAGNTAHGVYRTDRNIQIFIDINNVEELRNYSITDKSIELGGNISLTDAMTILEESSKNPSYTYCRDMAKHIDLIANVPVRNSGTIAGNLSIKHNHNEFPSDLFLILEAVEARINIAKDSTKKTSLSPLDYLQHDMKKSVILSITLKPIDSKKFTFKSYKIMPRAQNAHAYINAAFLIETNNDRIVSSNICFGGLHPNFIHAKKTEIYLVGKVLHNPEILKNSVKLLADEIITDWIPPDASPEYRKNLALSLFYKFVLATCPSDQIKAELKSGGEILQRPLSTGTQVFDTYKNRWPITQPIEKVEGLVQCSGEAQFINDIPHQPNELWAAFVLSKKAHAKIISIDPSDALKMPGVEYFFSAKDIPGANNFTPKTMMVMVEEEEILCSNITKYFGQPIGIILANKFELANRACELVKVEYIETGEKIIPTIEEAYKLDAKDRFHDTTAKMDAKTEGKNIKHTLRGRFEMAGQYHFTMETQTTVCIPIEDGLEVYASTQWIDLIQAAISQCVKIPESSINVQVRRLGGAYGAKISRTSQVACACAIASKLTNRPVRFVMSLESNMMAIGKRYGVVSDYEVNIDDNGKIQKLANNFAQDYGCSLNEDIVGGTTACFANCYITDTWNVRAKSVITDSPSNTWARAPATTEGIAMIENIMEHIARVAKKDSADVRLENISNDSKMRTLIPDFLNSIEYENRKSNIDEFNRNNRWRKRGIAFVPMRYAQGFFGNIPVLVSIYHTDGTVAITHGGIECGQGINTKVVQVAAHTLDIPIEYVKIKPALNYVVPNAIVTGGSMTSEAVCYATIKACEKILERIQPVRNEMKNAKWHEITDACNSKFIELSAVHMYKQPDVKSYTTWGLSSAEVEVDLLTGNFQLVRVDILEDTGESISPQIDVGQVEGAFVMGLGYWLTENLVYNTNTGELVTNRSWNYKPPGAKDIPIDFRVTFLRNSTNPASILRSKATGEPAFCMSIVAIFALRYALEAARKDAGIKDEWFGLGAPTTVEKVFLASGTKPEQFYM